MARKILVVPFLVSLVFTCLSCKSDQTSNTAVDNSSPKATTDVGSQKAAFKPKRDDGVYNRYNLHYFTKKNSNTASYANYTQCPGHNFLPYNTKFKVGSWGKGFKLTDVNTGLVILFEYNSPNMGGMSTRDYINLIMSPVPVSYDELSAEDQEGIKAGQAMLGMSKQGVMIALGYPAKHRTPSTDLNTWYYWKGRFNMLTVIFNEEGKVVSLR